MYLALAVDPSTPSTLYAGTWGGGVFQSTDRGGSWTAINTGLTALGVWALAIDPSTPSTLYAGTVDGGVFQSTNSGGSWTAINTGLTALDVKALTIDPSTPSTLYAGTVGGGVFQSTNSGGSWTAINTGLLTASEVEALAIDPTTPSTLYAGVFQSTDSGGSWTAPNAGLPWDHTLAIDPSTSSTLYAGTWAGVFQSTDSGANWSAINAGLTNMQVYALAIDPSTPSTLYAGTWGGGVFQSTDSGGSWMAINAGLTNTVVHVLAIDPSTPSTLYAGTSGGVFQSTNSGGSWTAVNAGLPVVGQGETYVYALAIHPSTPSTLYAGTWEGLFQSTDSGGSWTAVNAGLVVWDRYSSVPFAPSITALAIDPATPSTLYAGTSGSGVGGGVFQSVNGGGSWARVDAGWSTDTEGDSYVHALAIDPSAPSTLYAGTQGGVFDIELVQPINAWLTPGHGKNGCMLEWYTEPVTTLVGRNGLPVHQRTCTDDDPLCDFGATTGDDACTFHVALCLNVAESRFSCTPSDAAQVQLLSPNEAKPRGATASANRDALENAIAALGGAVRGLCANSGVYHGQLCAVNSDCDSTPGSSDGVCKGRFVEFTPPLDPGHSCTGFASILVPLKQTTTGFKAKSAVLRVKAISDTGQKGTNSLRLICKPHL